MTLIILVNDNKIDKQTKDKRTVFYSNDGDKLERRQRRQANSPPQDIYFNMFYLTVPENSRDFDIANVYVIDPDDDNYTCSVYTYDVPDDHQPFEIVNGILRTSLTMHNNNYDLDFETTPIYNITVTCTDPIHHFIISKNFSITVNDVNEAPVQLTLMPNVLPENSIAGYNIGQFYTVDPDIFQNQTFQYTMITNPNQLFKIENNSLILTRNNDVEMCISQPNLCPHDYEQIRSLLVRIRVDDSGQPAASQKFWIQISITDENDPPVNLQLDENTLKENSPIGTLVGIFSVQDQDLYQTHTYTLLNENRFFIENNFLRSGQAFDYEQEQFVLITVQVTDNGTIPKNMTNDFLIEIIDVDELPNTYVFISNIDNVISNDTINDLINEKQSVRTNYFPQNAYFQSTLGRIAFLIEDRDRDLNLNGNDATNLTELAFTKPFCELLTEIPYRLLCTSIVNISNPRSVKTDEHIIITSLILTSNNTTMTFTKPLKLKFENITLTINNTPTDSIIIPKDNSTSLKIGSIHAIDLVNGGQPIANVTLNPNSSLSYPLEIINSTILKVRDNVNLSSINSSLIFNVSVLITTADDDPRTIEKHLIVYVKDKMDFNLTLSNNQVMENSYENVSIGDFIFEDGIGNYTIDLADNANGLFQLNGTNLLTNKNYIEHCRLNHSCSFDHETESLINITIIVRDPSTNKILRQIIFPIEIVDENEAPYNLTLSNETVSENTPIGSTIGILNAIDDDSNQTLTYTTTNPSFKIIDKNVILTTKLNYDERQFLPIIIRATDNGQPSLFTEKLFIINVTAVNRSPINITSTPMIVYIPENANLTSIIVGQLLILDPDVRENFTISFNNPNFQALIPAVHSYTVISDDGSTVYAEVYNVSIVDLNPPNGQNQGNSLVNVTAIITDSGNHSLAHNFLVQYVSKSMDNSAAVTIIPPTTTTTASLSQALHIRIYETTPSGTPIVRGLITSSSSNDSLPNSPTCTVQDDQGNSFPVSITDTTPLAFIILLPNNYTLNSTIHPTIIINIQCHIANGTNVNQDIVIDVLPAPPTIEIKFNQIKPFYTTNNINNDTILGTFYPTELTTSTNRTFNLSLINNQDIFQLLPNGSLIQIGPYPSSLLQFDNPIANLTIETIETTPNEPTRIIQKTFRIPIIVNSILPTITFSQSSIPNDTNPNTIIGNFTIHNITTPYRLQLINTYNNSLQLDQTTNTITLKSPINTFPLINNRTQLPIEIALINQTNGTILTTMFPLTITYPIKLDSCLNKDCGNGTCIQSNDSSSYCLCTGGYTGIDCRTMDSCAYNPCTHNGICRQLSSRGDFSCQCLPNYSGLICETPIDVCQLNTSSCLSTDICVPINNNLTSFFTCFSRDELQYFVFDYLTDYKTIDVINDENFPAKIEDFIQNSLLLTENFVLPERKILGPYAYHRADLLSIGIQSSNESIASLNNTLELFCTNQSMIMNSFARQICAGYHQAIYLEEYFKSTPSFCPNCTFTAAADKYYWFDKTIPFLPLWITLILGSALLTAIPFLPIHSSTPKKVALPLMKAKVHPEDEHEETSVSIKSVGKHSSYSSRERNDSGYESNEDSNNYLEEIITNYQQQPFHVYPIVHQSRSPPIDDFTSTSRSNTPRRYIQRSSSTSAQKLRRQSSLAANQTPKPLTQRRSTLFDSSIETLVNLTGTPRLNNDDDTYVSTRFRNENTSKFVIGTLWNTFALVNNLFLQKPRKRRNAMTTDSTIHADQLAYLQQLYSLAEQQNQTDNLQSIITETLLEPSTNHLESVISDILSSRKQNHCTCYGNHHISSCIYYDHSLPYLRQFPRNTSRLESIFNDIQKTSKRNYQDASTQSYVEKPRRSFTHFKPTIDVATQSSPILSLTRLHSHVSTQYSPIQDISTEFQSKSNINEEKKIHDRRNSLMNELKQVISSPISKEKIINKETSRPSHTVRSLVSMFETTTNQDFQRKSSANNSKVFIPFDSTSLNTNDEEIHSPIVPDTIEEYANEIASNIVENAVLTATTTAMYCHEQQQQQRRFSLYNNAGGNGKSLLFQSNTFVPFAGVVKQGDQNFRANSRASSISLNDPLPSTLPINLESESQHTLIVGRSIDGNNAHQSRTSKHRSLILDTKFHSNSSSSSLEDEQIDHRQFLSNSQHFSAQELYIQPWLVRRSTAPDIHCLDNDITDTYIETATTASLPDTFFTIFPKNSNLNLYTRFTCLITILFYLRAIDDENSNRILYDELDQIENQLKSPISPSPIIHSNVFQTINSDGNKRYRTGFILDINSPKILAKQIEWKRVKLIIRRFRKKYQHHKQLMKSDKPILSNTNLNTYLKYFDSTSKRRVKKYAKHYAEKI